MNMQQQNDSLVIDGNGMRGLLDVAGTPEQIKRNGQFLVHLENGTGVFVPANEIVASQAGGYLLSRGFEEFGTAQQLTNNSAPPQNTGTGQQMTEAANTPPRNLEDQLVVPVLAEELQVGRESVVTGGVRVHKRVVERTEVVDQPIQSEEVEVERIPINQIVETAPAVRYEGDVIVVPLVEEVVVTEKRLMLREEVRIRRHKFETRKPQEVILRREQVEFEEIVPGESAKKSSANS
jgi:uncharacterized protein (TIGR02271 family)